nr:ComF family protein [Chloroflexota bacterium]
TWVCDPCARATPLYAPPWCLGCGIPLALGHCACANTPPGVTLIRSVGSYEGWLREAIIAFKYQDERARADHLGAHLSDRLPTLGGLDALTFVPLHRSRQRRRGYNQSELLARVAGASAGLRVLTTLSRTRETAPQVGLHASQRQQNVRGAFSPVAGVSINGLRLGLIDDVLTTGATIGECATALGEAGARSVSVLVLARDSI